MNVSPTQGHIKLIQNNLGDIQTRSNYLLDVQKSRLSDEDIQNSRNSSFSYEADLKKKRNTSHQAKYLENQHSNKEAFRPLQYKQASFKVGRNNFSGTGETNEDLNFYLKHQMSPVTMGAGKSLKLDSLPMI